MADVKENFLDYIAQEDYDRYQELLVIAAECKAKAPKKPRVKKELTDDEKVAAARKKIEQYEAKIAALLAAKEG